MKEREVFRAKEEAYQALNSTLESVKKENVILMRKMEEVKKRSQAKQHENSTIFTCIIVVFVVIAILALVFVYKESR